MRLLVLSLASLALIACSTAALSVSPFDDDDETPALDAARPVPQPDAARPLSTWDATVPPPVPPPRPDPGAPPVATADAGRPLPPRDAGSPTPMDASQPPRAEFDAAGLWPAADAAVTCAIHNQAACPAASASMSPCKGIDAPFCAYPEPVPNSYLLRSCTGDGPGRLNQEVTRVQCPHDCFREIPSSFEGLNVSDCAGRQLVRCESFPTDQLAVDLALKAAALACGLKTHHLGLMFNSQGCAVALFGREIRDPAIRCIGKLLNTQRFSCAPPCAVANSDL